MADSLNSVTNEQISNITRERAKLKQHRQDQISQMVPFLMINHTLYMVSDTEVSANVNVTREDLIAEAAKIYDESAKV